MRETILIIDDNEDILDFLSEVLGEHYQTQLATNAQTGLKILEDQFINLIISDIMMPGMNGFELCNTIKAHIEYCHIPVILLTSKNSQSARISGLEVGADAYVKKPFSTNYLQLQVKNLLNNRVRIKDHFANSPFEDPRILAQSKTDEIFLKKLDEFIRGNIKDSNMDIDTLSYHMNMSRTTFYRKVKSLSSLTPKELIDVTRLKKATELIARNEFPLIEVSRMVGYSSQSVFGKNFQKHFKMSPMEYQTSLQPNRNHHLTILGN